MRKSIHLIIKKVLNRETILYGIFGVCTTIVNFGVYTLLIEGCGVVLEVSNFVALALSIIFSYITNKIWVFNSKTENITELLYEIIKFAFARGITLLIDFFGVIILVRLMKSNELIAKALISIIVVVLNYFLTKKGVFSKKES